MSYARPRPAVAADQAARLKQAVAGRGRQKLTTKQRGYSGVHQKTRAYWAPIVEGGRGYCTEPVCLYPSRWIRPGTPWHLAHGDGQAGYRGPAHRRCNLAERNRRRNRETNARRRGKRTRPRMVTQTIPADSLRTSRQW